MKVVDQFSAMAPAADPVPEWDRIVFRPTGTITTTGVSGKAGSVNIARRTRHDFLAAIGLSETKDKPVYMIAALGHERALSPRVPDRVFNSGQVIVGKKPDSSRSRKFAKVPSALARLDNGTMRVIAGVRVCMNKKRTRVKGIKVYGASIDPSGAVTRGSEFNGGFQRPNCTSPWHPRKMCPTNQVATGLEFHTKSGILTGIALQCQRVTTATLVTR